MFKKTLSCLILSGVFMASSALAVKKQPSFLKRGYDSAAKFVKAHRTQPQPSLLKRSYNRAATFVSGHKVSVIATLGTMAGALAVFGGYKYHHGAAVAAQTEDLPATPTALAIVEQAEASSSISATPTV